MDVAHARVAIKNATLNHHPSDVEVAHERDHRMSKDKRILEGALQRKLRKKKKSNLADIAAVRGSKGRRKWERENLPFGSRSGEASGYGAQVGFLDVGEKVAQAMKAAGIKSEGKSHMNHNRQQLEETIREALSELAQEDINEALTGLVKSREWSSYEKDQQIFENWRAHIDGNSNES